MKAGGLLYFLRSCTSYVTPGALRIFAEGPGGFCILSVYHPCRSCRHSSRLTASANQPMDGMRSMAWP